MRSHSWRKTVQDQFSYTILCFIQRFISFDVETLRKIPKFEEVSTKYTTRKFTTWIENWKKEIMSSVWFLIISFIMNSLFIAHSSYFSNLFPMAFNSLTHFKCWPISSKPYFAVRFQSSNSLYEKRSLFICSKSK